jgi:hypothetical protein
VNVFGEFPEHSINALISPIDVERALAMNLRPDAYDMAQKRIGADIARQGEDMSVFFPRQGLRAMNYVEFSGAKTYELADSLINSKLKWGCEQEYVDGTGGFGGGVIDDMQRRKLQTLVTTINELRCTLG